MTPFGLLLVALCAYRLTRLVALDDLTEGPRDWFVRKVGPDSKLADLAGCVYCVGAWLTPAVLAVWLHGGRLGYWLVVIGACVGGQALLNSWEGE